ncbi:ribonuclease T2 [Lentibacter sp. XHP0401]|jgi:ribonuclease T2|uniref:ribonuclease T2 n=1 Tax=Lentibacter sp. XHP0401 TaxID=2984334 RepID=UPI0021E807E9|nr:ribonuclease T2 [Lentibacter sp. XHP0401]MCV2893758.1 ribonuclease T2 [Lentibacter sp. XHP0401]
MLLRAFVGFLLLTGAAFAKGERAGEFDYYVMSLSWSPNWCALEGDAKGSPQCNADKEHGWVLHGLWPQYHQGWPSFCPTIEPQPPRSLTNTMADIMGTSGLAWYQWKKHGVCSGLSAPAYYDLSRKAFESIMRPPVFRKLDKTIKLPASVVEDAFIKANPSLRRDMITITCRAGHIQEARICLGKDLSPVPCGRDVSRDCSLNDALFEPVD